jgi:hypothetical protein
MSQAKPTSEFVFTNALDCSIFLILEPEGAQFALPPGETVQVLIFGAESPIAVKQSVDSGGQFYLSFWYTAHFAKRVVRRH